MVDKLCVLFLILIFWMIWLGAYDKAKRATEAQPQVQYYVVVPY